MQHQDSDWIPSTPKLLITCNESTGLPLRREQKTPGILFNTCRLNLYRPVNATGTSGWLAASNSAQCSANLRPVSGCR